MKDETLKTTLEESIGEWRAYLRRRKAIHKVDIEELEDHLRSQIRGLVDAGLSDEEAFLVAVKRIGDLDALSREFAREYSERLWKQLVVSPKALLAVGLFFLGATGLIQPLFPLWWGLGLVWSSIILWLICRDLYGWEAVGITIVLAAHTLFQALAMLIYLSVGGHLMLLRGLADSLEALPPGTELGLESGAGLAWLFALFLASVAGHVASLLEDRLIVFIHADERSRDAVPNGLGLR